LKDKERFALAEQVQKRIQEEQPHFWLTKRRDEINNELEVKRENRRFKTINENIETEEQKSMKSIWNDYKVWILIGFVYTGFFLLKNYKSLKQKFSTFHTKFISLQSLPTKEN